MEIKDAFNACDYLSWAYYHDIDLTFTFVQSDIDSCNSLANSYYNSVLDVDEGLGYLGANQYLRKLLDQLKTITGHINFRDTFFYKNFRERAMEPTSLDASLGAGADQQPVFYFYMTEQVYMRQLLSGVIGKTNRAQYPQVFQTAPKPSLQFAIEVILNNDGTKSVAAHLGDNDIILGGCTTAKCDLEAFKTYLTSVATLDVPTVCATKQSRMGLYQ
jgi:hypothetical protein